MPFRPVASTALVFLACACTETPGSFPPCVDPSNPCAAYDAGEEASADATATDGAGPSQDTGSADVATPSDAAPVDGATFDAIPDAGAE